MNIGLVNTLQAVRPTSVGMFLTDEEGNEVLLPMKHVPEDLRPGDTIDVFVYTDSEDRPVAVRELPLVQRDMFGYLRVRDTSDIGAFLDWGLEKDLLLPYREQTRPLSEGDNILVHVYLDEQSERMMASARVNKFFVKADDQLETGTEVDILVTRKTDLGHSCVINNLYEGLIYNNEVFEDIRNGEVRKAYVYNVRPDGRVDIRLQRWGTESMDEYSEKVMSVLKENRGFVQIGDKSNPESIRVAFGMSKRNFKQAAGNLFKQKLVEISDESIKLTE